MKLATVTALATMLSAGYAFAGGGAPAPPVPEGGAPSGRPSAVLDEAKCAMGLGYELSQQDPNIAADDLLYEVRSTLNRISTAAVSLYR